MFCKNCGAKLSDNAKFCANCGAQVKEDTIIAEIDPQIVEFKGLRFDAVDFMIKYDVLGHGRIEATKYLMDKTGAGMMETVKFMGTLCGSKVLKDIVTKEQIKRKQNSSTESVETEGLFCPKCYSHDIYIDKRGYSLTKGVIGTLILGPVGLIAGKHKSNQLRYTCKHCKHQWTD